MGWYRISLTYLMLIEKILFVYYNCSRRNILINNTSCTNHAIVSYSNTFQNHNITTYPAMISNVYGCRTKTLLLYWNIRILITVVMIIHLHILSEDCTISNRYMLYGIQGAVIVEEDIVSNNNLSLFVYHNRETLSESQTFPCDKFTTSQPI